MRNFTRPKPLAWFFFLAAFGTTVGLGTWQVQRLQWKEALIAEIESAKQNPPITTLPQDAASLAAINFRPVEVHGTWVDTTEFEISPRFFRGVLGYFVITPLALDDGRILLVNRGWVPSAKKELATRPETTVSGAVTLNGLLRVGDERNWLTPPSDATRNLWFGRDTLAMAQHAGLENPVPAMLDIIGPQDPKSLPVPSDGVIRLRNDHLSYILTWYGIALGILVIFVLAHRKK